ncbi:MAG: arsenate reductase ArsC [Spirochaetia bacterium]|nr:arsenate reductase ArsC [uncultured Sphaerochaeta sp.]NCC13351.1 arsenate reductase ArsC [Spirochaetia bacterium]NCC90097.1 arsenate reductase ArsC [Spirochaetia bacterium]
MTKPTVAFVCVHNSCRSQMAEALATLKYGHLFSSFSGGTETKDRINQDAVRMIKKLYEIDMEATQYSKLIDHLPAIDILITMGCNVHCPYLPCKHREDWGLDDPSGKGEQAFIQTIGLIEEKLADLAVRIEAGLGTKE